MEKEVAIWAALADDKRRQIITLLEEKPCTTSELSKHFDVSRFAVMKHLNVLEKASLIRVERQGRERWNILNDELAHFLRTKLAGEEDSSRLVQLLDLFPGSRPAADTHTLEHELLLQAAPQTVFQAITSGIDLWWSSRRWDTSQIKLEPRLNGRFYETLAASDQGILYGIVTTFWPDKELRLRGTLEFGQQIAGSTFLHNDLHIVLNEKQAVTHLSLTHRLQRGRSSASWDRLEQGWRRLLQMLQAYVERGATHHKNKKQNGAGG